MKTILIIFFLYPSVLFGQLKVDGFVELGLVNDGLSLYIPNTTTNTYFRKNDLSCVIFASVTYNIFTYEQGITNYFKHFSGLEFSPLEVEYSSKFFISLANFDIGVSHTCLHPVKNYQEEELYRSTIRIATDKIFLRYSFSLTKK